VLDARTIAARFWTEPDTENRAAYLRVCGPLYTQTPGNLFEPVEMVRNNDLFAHWNVNEHASFDLRNDLAEAQCPVLVLGGQHDPVCPIVGSEEIVAHLPPQRVQLERFAHSGHGVFRDEAERANSVLRQFVTSCSDCCAGVAVQDRARPLRHDVRTHRVGSPRNISIVFVHSIHP